MNADQALDQALVDAIYSNDAMAVVARYGGGYDVVRYSRIQTELRNYDAITRIVDPYIIRRDCGVYLD